MKFSAIFATFSAVAAQEERGMQPPKRLAKTSDNFKLWLEQNIQKASDRSRWSDRIDKMTANMLSAYDRENCGFYDESLTNGGPDPNPELRPNGKPRKTFERRRRQVEEDELRFDETNPVKGLKQITGKLGLWADRHINECGGQRRFNHINRRMEKWVTKLTAKWEDQA
ncbi:Oidioi.mRNA.OKI2018_I69.chr2.g6802.t1.cds [Oikopleura dioica]|uniref:Oidioi.mRNA.OKI2018_I69.chr2.g6802.t1.cds n=1 Tax=Oikopleura dioica TaxID=34765 RepID=A0ABN7T7P5_OIKDI|nr:Oidioi.mRNA.OKI2018_I69.chr2.g6802.t1.cds [Oikopleura dioica]